MRLFSYLSVMIVAATLLFSCRAMKEPDYKGIDSFKINGIGEDTSTLLLNLKYFNPNRQSVRLKDAEGDAYVDSVYLGHFYMDTVIRISGNSDFIVPVLLKANMKNVFKNAISVFMNNDFNLRLQGKCKAGKGGIYMTYPINYSGKQSLKLF